jgi:hypothetical protein
MATVGPCSHRRESRSCPHLTVSPKPLPLAASYLACHVRLLALANRSCLPPPCTLAIWQRPTVRLVVAAVASCLPCSNSRCHTQFQDQNQMLIVCMPRIKLLYIWPECKYRKTMSLLYRILLQKLITSPERTKQWNGHHLATGK